LASGGGQAINSAKIRAEVMRWIRSSEKRRQVYGKAEDKSAAGIFDT
jgi:hypothetical protein